jgi:hypothetical protein
MPAFSKIVCLESVVLFISDQYSFDRHARTLERIPDPGRAARKERHWLEEEKDSLFFRTGSRIRQMKQQVVQPVRSRLRSSRPGSGPGWHAAQRRQPGCRPGGSTGRDRRNPGQRSASFDIHLPTFIRASW